MKRLTIASLLLFAGCSAPSSPTASSSVGTPPQRNPSLNPSPSDSVLERRLVPPVAERSRPLPINKLDSKTGSRVTRNGLLSPSIAASFQTIERAKTLAQLQPIMQKSYGLEMAARSEARQIGAKGTPLQKEIAQLRIDAHMLTTRAANERYMAFQLKAGVTDNVMDNTAITPDGLPLRMLAPRERQRLIESLNKPSAIKPTALKVAGFADELLRRPRSLTRVRREAEAMRSQPRKPRTVIRIP